MGALLKFILIIGIIYWLFKTVGKFFFNTLTNKEGGQNPFQGNQQQPPREGSIHVDYNPNEKKGNQQDFKGGEYVDYEEVD